MKRQEFIDDVRSFYDLIQFCNEYGYDGVCEDIFDDDERDELIEEDISDALQHCSWRAIRDNLNDIPTGHDWYRRDGLLEYSVLYGADFESHKEVVLRLGDEDGIWEDEENEYAGFDDVSEEDTAQEDDTFKEPDISMEELAVACFKQVKEYAII